MGLLLNLALGECLPSAASTTSQRRNEAAALSARQTIVALGDSITLGLHDTQPGGWPARLSRLLQQDYGGSSFNVVNAGIKGVTTAGMLQRLDRVVLAQHPQFVIIFLGANDFDYGVPAVDFRSALTGIVTRLQAANVPHLVVSMLPIGLFVPRLLAEQAYNAVIPEVCAATGTGYLDEFNRWLALGGSALKRLHYDAEHLNSQGYRLLAAEIASILETEYISPNGHLNQAVNPPDSDLSSVVNRSVWSWRQIEVHTTPGIGISVTITATGGTPVVFSGRTNHAGSFAVHNGQAASG